MRVSALGIFTHTTDLNGERSDMPWPEMIDFAATHDLRLYVISSKPTNGLGPILANLEEHVAYPTTPERRRHVGGGATGE
jgi:hypothetical protein